LRPAADFLDRDMIDMVKTWNSGVTWRWSTWLRSEKCGFHWVFLWGFLPVSRRKPVPCNEGALKSASTSSFHSYATFVEKQGPTHDSFTRIFRWSRPCFCCFSGGEIA
jgi:hypothetical protein